MAAKTAPVKRRRALKIRSGDQVRVIAGKDRGKSGRVLRDGAAQGTRLRRGPEHGQAPHAPAAIGLDAQPLASSAA